MYNVTTQMSIYTNEARNQTRSRNFASVFAPEDGSDTFPRNIMYRAFQAKAWILLQLGCHRLKNRNCSASVPKGYEQDGRGLIPGRTKNDCSLYHSFQTGYGAHPASYPVDTVGSFQGSKAART
jgi:hypothetical protein